MEKVSIENVSFKYAGTEKMVLDSLNISVNKGDFVCLLGPSGCGKSTLLRLLAGLETPTEGSIKIDEDVIAKASLNRSVVFQDYGLFPWKTAGDNIVLALKMKYPDKKKTQWKEMAEEMLKKVGLPEDVYRKYPRELSGGMQQRCAIARSFAINPPILLMDEPFGALDAVTRAKLQEMVLALWKQDEERKTVFFVTHDVDEALLLGNRICVLGQTPSKLIFECMIDENDKPTRSTLFKNEAIMELRNELISYINQDITEHF